MKYLLMKIFLSLLLIIEFYPIETYSQDSASDKNSVAAEEKAPIKNIILYESHQSETKGVTRISFDVVVPGKVNLNVYDSNGEVIETLVDSDMEAGEYDIFFKAPDKLMPGVYKYRLESEGSILTKNLTLIK